MTIIYHITSKTDWHAALTTNSYAADSLASEGFIHCSTAQQVVHTASRLFKGRGDLVLLCIDTAKVNAGIRHENLAGGADLFPHIYGPLEIAAVVAVHDFQPRADGSFEAPAALRATITSVV